MNRPDKSVRQLARGLAALATLFFFIPVSPADAKIRMAAIFRDHMVLQQGMAVPVWGWAEPGEEISVTAAEASAGAKAGADGKWMVRLPRMLASATPIKLVVAGATETVTVNDVLIGDVWLASGQSNMAMALRSASNADDVLPKANHPQFRFFKVRTATQNPLEPADDCFAWWEVCTPESAKSLTAVGYFFITELAKTRNIPFGLLSASHGGTGAEKWISRKALEADPELKKAYIDPLLKNIAAAAAGEPNAMKGSQNTALFNTLIHPVIPYAIRGAIWYQGEANCYPPSSSFLYRKLFPAMITDWRVRWGQGDFPFLIVQLPNHHGRQDVPVIDGGWAFVREGQLLAARNLPKTGMAVTIDCGEDKDIHPAFKSEVGRRLALVARRVTYGEDITAWGPLLESYKVDGNKVYLKFSSVGKGLKIGVPPKGSKTPVPAPDKLRGFAIAGADGRFVWADAVIQGRDTVVVAGKGVASPVAVRYGWANNPEVNLYNSEDLPASPFRTDSDVAPR